jgi:kynureninase
MTDVCEGRRLFPATAGRAYLNTAAVGLASRQLADAYHTFVEEWATAGLDYRRGEQAADNARSAVARLLGAEACDIALIPSVSSAAGLVAAQLGRPGPGENVVIGEGSTARTISRGASSPQRDMTSGKWRSATAGSSPKTSASAWTPVHGLSRSAPCSPRPATGPTSRRSAT